MFYRLVYKKKSAYSETLKIILLIAGLLCDIATVSMFIFAVLGAYLYFAFLLGSLAFGIFFRIAALTLVYDVEYKLQDGYLAISKIYPNKTKQLMREQLQNLEVREYNSEEYVDIDKNKNIINLRVNKTQCYILSDGKHNYLCNLDKYLYACILKGEEI